MLVVSVGCVFDILWTTGLLAFSWLCIRPLRGNRLSVETCYNSARWDQNVVKRVLSMIVNVTSGALQWILRIPIYYLLTFATRLGHHLQCKYDAVQHCCGHKWFIEYSSEVQWQQWLKTKWSHSYYSLNSGLLFYLPESTFMSKTHIFPSFSLYLISGLSQWGHHH